MAVDRRAPAPYDGRLAPTAGAETVCHGEPGVSWFPINRRTTGGPIEGGAWLRLRDAGLAADDRGRSLPGSWET